MGVCAKPLASSKSGKSARFHIVQLLESRNRLQTEKQHLTTILGLDRVNYGRRKTFEIDDSRL